MVRIQENKRRWYPTKVGMMLSFKDETPDGLCEGKGNGINKLGVQLTSSGW